VLDDDVASVLHVSVVLEDDEVKLASVELLDVLLDELLD